MTLTNYSQGKKKKQINSCNSITLHNLKQHKNLIKMKYKVYIILTVSTGIENPTPEDAPEGEYIAVFIPIRFPELSRSGPPLLPGLIAASVCITS